MERGERKKEKKTKSRMREQRESKKTRQIGKVTEGEECVGRTTKKGRWKTIDRPSHTGSKRGIEHVNVDADINGRVADTVLDLAHDGCGTARLVECACRDHVESAAQVVAHVALAAEQRRSYPRVDRGVEDQVLWTLVSWFWRVKIFSGETW
jgi:hypothetical protein